MWPGARPVRDVCPVLHNCAKMIARGARVLTMVLAIRCRNPCKFNMNDVHMFGNICFERNLGCYKTMFCNHLHGKNISSVALRDMVPVSFLHAEPWQGSIPVFPQMVPVWYFCVLYFAVVGHVGFVVQNFASKNMVGARAVLKQP